MRFIVDECTGPAAAKWLRERGHEIFSVFDEARGADDDQIIRKARDEKWILITNDTDFGAKVYRDRVLHEGVILLRLEDERSPAKIKALDRLITAYGDDLPGNFVVVSEGQVRFTGM